MVDIARLALEVDSRSANKAARDLDGLARSGKKTEKEVSTFSAKSSAAMAAFGVVVAGVATAAVSLRSSLNFTTSLAEVSTLVDETTFSMKGLQATSKALAQEFGTLPVEQTKAFYQVISAGASTAAEATEILTAANKLAVGGVTDVTTAADGLTSVLNAYGDQVEGATSVSDALFVGMRAGKTTIEELSSGLGKVAPIAASLNVSFDELTASVSALTKGGISTQESITGIRAVLAAVAKPTKEAADLSAELGIQFDAAGLQAKGFQGFLEDLAARTGGSTEKLAQLFGGVEALVPVMALSGQAGQDFADVMESMATKAGETETAFNKMADSPGFKIDRLMASINSIGLTLGGTLADVLAPAAEAVANALNKITGSSSVISELSEIAKQEQKILDIQKELRSEQIKGDFFGPFAGNIKEIHELEQNLEDAKDDLDKMRVSAEEAATAVGKVADEIIEIPVAAGVGGGSGGGSGGISSATKEIDKLRKSIFDLTNQFDPLARLNSELADLVRLRETGELRKDIFDAAATESINRYVDSLETVTEETKEVDAVTEELGNTGRRVFDDISQFAIQGARSIQTAFADALLEGVNGFKSFADSALDIIKRLAANIASVKILEGLGIGGLLGVGSSSALAGSTNAAGGFTNAFGSGGGLINSFATSGVGQFLGLSQLSQGPVSVPTLTGAGSFLTGFTNAVFPAVVGGALGIGIGSSIAGDKTVFGANGTVTSAIGTGIGGGIGAFFGGPLGAGLGAGFGGLIGGAISKVFGREAFKVQETRLLGDITVEGFSGVTNTRATAKGGVLRGNKTDNIINDTDTGELLNSFKGLRESGISSQLDSVAASAAAAAQVIGGVLDKGVQGLSQSLSGTAEVLGIGTQSLEGFSREIDIISASGELLSDQQIAQTLSDVGDHMANVLLPGLQDMVREGETAFTALARITQEFTSLEDALIVFGVSAEEANAAISALSVATRTELVDAAGGVEALNGQITFFANNFLSAEEQLSIGFAKLDADMQALGLSADITVEEFKNLIISVTQAGGASVELASALLQLAPSFLNIKRAQEGLAAQLQTAAPRVDNLTGSVNNLSGAAGGAAASINNTAAAIQASFARIDTARSNLAAAENALATANARSVLSDAQAQLSIANNALSTARSNLSAAQSAEQQRQSAAQQSVVDEINDVVSQRSELISAYRQEASALKGVVDRFGALSDKIIDFKDSLALSNLSPFSPGEQLAIARQQFNATRGLAAQGNEGALDRLPEVSRTFLEASKTFNGATGAFESDFNFVQQVLESSGATARATSDIAAQQLVGIEGTISELEALNKESQKIIKSLNSGFKDVTDGVMSVEQATAELAEAQSDFDDAQAAVDKAIRDNGGFINDVKSATNAVETAVRELGAAILQGFGNLAISDQQIVDFINANPGLSDPQIIQEAIKNGISASQLQRATGVSFGRINTAAQGLSVRDDQISSFVDQKLAEGDLFGIYNTARANGISSDQLASASQLSKEQINQFVSGNGLQAFALGTDLITKTGPALVHKGEGITPSSVPGEIKKLREELAELRREQNQQMSALINVTEVASKENAKVIVTSNQTMAKNANWQNRSKPKAA